MLYVVVRLKVFDQVNESGLLGLGDGGALCDQVWDTNILFCEIKFKGRFESGTGVDMGGWGVVFIGKKRLARRCGFMVELIC